MAAAGRAALSLAGCSSSRPSLESAPPTPAEKAYLKNIAVAGARMFAANNFLQHTVTTLQAQVTNRGDQTVRYLELNLEFTNYMDQIDLRDQARPINFNTPPLKPGEARTFEVSFDHVPEDWNQAPPRITPLRVVLAAR